MKNKPNIIFLMIDQLRADRLDSFQIFQDLKQEGVFFPNMVTYAPYTVASVHAILTGMYGCRNGVDSYYGNLDFDADNCMTLQQYLLGQGYYTKADVLSKIILPAQGFSEITVHDEYKDNLALRHKDMIKEAGTRAPFFLFFQYSNIHTGIISQVVNKFTDDDKEYFHQTDRNLERYDGFVAQAGRYLREIIDLISNDNALRDTLIVVLTDHGCSLGEKPGEKCYGVFVYDYTVMTFAYFIYNSLLPKARQVNALVRTIDIMPSLMAMLGIEQKEGFKKMQGESFYDGIEENRVIDREAYIETAPLSGPHPSPNKPNICAYRTKDWKLIYNEATAKRELYDLGSDPQENRNLSGKSMKVEEELLNKMSIVSGRIKIN
ncbi:MAG: hypothetical protein C4533_04235 [Candidatus Omnitrophota bacterium]|jgi:arylsulfatase A-like enzyme|nr:MAG: hypothetical protein C4533_04235 [Candidatus Omnitrophota bacterium]